jgi:hypothetical protein
MTRIDKFSSIRSTNVEGTEHAQPAATNQPQSEAVNTPAPSANSGNTWQRASLVQDGIVQQTRLAQSYESSKAEIEREKEAKEENHPATLWGTIFDGPIIGSAIGNGIDTNVSDTEANKSPLRDLVGASAEEMKKLQEQMKEVYDNSFVETAGGKDDLPIEAYTKVQYDPDDDD